MNEEKLYTVKNDKGEYWEFKDLCGFDLGGFLELLDVSVPFTVSEEDAKNTAKDHGGHVVELVEDPAKVVVSEEEAEMLEQLRTDENASPAGAIRNYFWGSVEGQNDDNKPRWSRENEARLMRAYVNGWTVNKPKLWNAKVPHTADELYWKRGNGNIGCTGAWRTDDEIVRNQTFTDAEIEHYGLQDCEKTEVPNED